MDNGIGWWYDFFIISVVGTACTGADMSTNYSTCKNNAHWVVCCC